MRLKSFATVAVISIFAGILLSCTATKSTSSDAGSTNPSPSPSPSGGNTPALLATDPSAEYLISCPLDSSTGAAGTCVNNGYSFIPYGLITATFGSSRYAYITSNSTIWKCTIDASGSPSCMAAISGVVGSQARGLNVATVGGTTYLFVAEALGHVYVCPLDTSSGGFASSCTASNTGVTASSWHPFGIAVATVGSNSFGYVADTYGNIYLCSVNSSTGEFTGCAASNGGGSFGAYAVQIVTIGSNNYAYVADINGNVFKCSVNATTGALAGCAASNGGVTAGSWSPTGVTVVSIGGTYHAYVADYANSKVFLCSVSASDGSLSGCATVTGPGSGWVEPWSVAVSQ